MKKVTCYFKRPKINGLLEKLFSEGLKQIRLFQFDTTESIELADGGGKMEFDTKIELYTDKNDMDTVVDELLMFKYFTSGAYIETMELERTLVMEEENKKLMDLLDERRKLCLK